MRGEIVVGRQGVAWGESANWGGHPVVLDASKRRCKGEGKRGERQEGGKERPKIAWVTQLYEAESAR